MERMPPTGTEHRVIGIHVAAAFELLAVERDPAIVTELEFKRDTRRGPGENRVLPGKRAGQGMRVKLSQILPCFREIPALFPFVVATISGQRLFKGGGLLVATCQRV
ncbi:MAG: hypothetical protein NTW21_13875, partial [Verrucomicrobia bacterium]|nr:hypothetical protein [Verrucomicrobiota bacterium]